MAVFISVDHACVDGYNHDQIMAGFYHFSLPCWWHFSNNRGLAQNLVVSVDHACGNSGYYLDQPGTNLSVRAICGTRLVTQPCAELVRLCFS